MQSGQPEFTENPDFLTTLGREFSTVLSEAKVEDVCGQDIYSVIAQYLGKPLTFNKLDEMGKTQIVGLASAFNDYFECNLVTADIIKTALENTVKHWAE